MDGGVVDDSKDADEQDLVPSHAKKDVKGKGKAVEPITMATETAKNAHDSDEMARLKAELAFKESLITSQLSYLSSIRSAMSCHVCLETLDRPYSLSCGHVFCRKCLAQWFHRPDPAAEDAAAAAEDLVDGDDSDAVMSIHSTSDNDGSASEHEDDSQSDIETIRRPRSNARNGDDEDQEDGRPIIRGTLFGHSGHMRGLTARNEDAVWDQAMSMFGDLAESAFAQSNGARAAGRSGTSGSSSRRRIEAAQAEEDEESEVESEDDEEQPPKPSMRNKTTRDEEKIVELSSDDEAEHAAARPTTSAAAAAAAAAIARANGTHNAARPPMAPPAENDDSGSDSDDVIIQPAAAAAAPLRRDPPTGAHRLSNLVCPQCRASVASEPPVKIFVLVDALRPLREAEKAGLFGERGTSTAPAAAASSDDEVTPGLAENDATWGGLWKDEKDESPEQRRKRRAAVVRDRDDGVRRCGLCNWEIDEESGVCNGCGHEWDLSDDGERVGNESDEEGPQQPGFMLAFNGRPTAGAGGRPRPRVPTFLEDSARSEDDDDERDSADDAFIDDEPVARKDKKKKKKRSREHDDDSESESGTSALSVGNVLPSRTRTGRRRGRDELEAEDEHPSSESSSSSSSGSGSGSESASGAEGQEEDDDDGFIAGPARKYRRDARGGRTDSSGSGSGSGSNKSNSSSEVDSDEDVAVKLARRRVKKSEKHGGARDKKNKRPGGATLTSDAIVEGSSDDEGRAEAASARASTGKGSKEAITLSSGSEDEPSPRKKSKHDGKSKGKGKAVEAEAEAPARSSRRKRVIRASSDDE